MSDTEFGIFEGENYHTFLRVFSEDAGIQLMIEIDRRDVEEIRAALPDKPPNHDDTEDSEDTDQ